MIDAFIDTGILVDYLRGHEPAQIWLAALSRRQRVIAAPVWLEVVGGARDKQERGQILRFLRQFRVELLTGDDQQWAMRQFAQYHLSHGVEWSDTLIAAPAVRLEVPLYTINIKHFAPLIGVQVIQPY